MWLIDLIPTYRSASDELTPINISLGPGPGRDLSSLSILLDIGLQRY